MLGYLLDRFPVASETFVVREVEALARRGVRPRLWALSRGDVVDGTEYLTSQLEVLPGVLSIRNGLAEIATMLAHPARYLVSTASLVRGCARSPRTFLAELLRSDAAFTLARRVAREGVTHLHAHFGFVASTVAYAVWRLARVPYSVSVHAWDIFANRSMMPEKLVAARSVVTCTEYARRFLLDRYRVLRPERVVCAHHGLDVRAFDPSNVPPSCEGSFVAVGRLEPKKGFDVLLRAFAAARVVLEREGRPARLTIVGAGRERARLEVLAAGLGLGASLRMAGALGQRDVREELARACCLVVPSVMGARGDRDGLPNVVLEAMAASRAVVGSRFSGIPEAVEHGRTGLLAQPGDAEGLARALVAVGCDRELARRMGAAGRAVVVERFSLEAAADRIERVFRSLGVLPQ